jgi:Protein tyrosine and serine/threonine kinase
MLCIEIFTENAPYSEVTNEMFIPVVIGKGSPPLRPGNSATARGLSDAMWDLMNQCWQLQPTSRPSMTKVREVIQNMHPLRSSMSHSLIDATYSYSLESLSNGRIFVFDSPSRKSSR